jgi:hypothetical protein
MFPGSASQWMAVDDRFLYVSSWATGELRQYEVADPFKPTLTGAVRLGGIVRRTAHPNQPSMSLNGGTAPVARAVYDRLGLRLLRQAWFNLDLVWAVALATTGGLTALM